MEEEPRRFFSLEEANDLIPMLTKALREIYQLRQAIVNVLDSKRELSKGNGHIEDPTQTSHDLLTASNAVARITHLLETIGETGALLKDLDSGLVDFPYSYGERTVYLCWRMGEEAIGFWHETDAGVAGREPIDSSFR